MAEFTGTLKEFTSFIGGYTRNKVQYITRTHKKKIGKCEKCNSRTKKLDAAHLKGKERPLIIANILQNFSDNEEEYKVDLNSFEEQYLAAHNPIDNTIKVLCKKCHKEYDNLNKTLKHKKSNEAEDIEDLIKTISLSKKDSKLLLESNGYKEINNSNLVFSNINKSLNVFWLEPNNRKFNEDLYFVLNDSINKIMNIFFIPKDSISPKKEFDQRNDKESSKIIIENLKNKYLDKKGFDLGPFYKGSVNY